MNNTYTICYNRLCVYKNKQDAIKEYAMACYCCDPMSHEHMRYTNILCDLQFSNIGHDGVSDDINTIFYEDIKRTIKINTQNYEKIVEKLEKGETIYEN